MMKLLDFSEFKLHTESQALKQIYECVVEHQAMEVFEKAKHINLQMMDYAMEIIDKEDSKKLKQQKKLQKKLA